MSSLCPFTKVTAAATCPVKHHKTEDKEQKDASAATCPVKHHKTEDKEQKDVGTKDEEKGNDSSLISPKCPFGYDSQSFKLGPFSCMICQALLYQCSKCMPCSHKFCKTCISRFKDCPLCGADIENVEPDKDLQDLVDRFIEGHARIKRSQSNLDTEARSDTTKKVIYEDVSMERGAFLVQQAMRAFRGQNIESAKARLNMCAEDIREQLKTSEQNEELCAQLGAVSGMLGDCCRAMGDAVTAVNYYKESAESLSKLPTNNLEIVHTLSVSLNKVGDLQYYDGDLQSARSYYARSLDVRRSAAKEHSSVPSQVIDLATSLAKVADVDRNIGNESVAIEGFKEAIEHLESLKLDAEQANLQQKRQAVLDFLKSQLDEN